MTFIAITFLYLEWTIVLSQSFADNLKMRITCFREFFRKIYFLDIIIYIVKGVRKIWNARIVVRKWLGLPIRHISALMWANVEQLLKNNQKGEICKWKSKLIRLRELTRLWEREVFVFLLHLVPDVAVTEPSIMALSAITATEKVPYKIHLMSFWNGTKLPLFATVVEMIILILFL